MLGAVEKAMCQVIDCWGDLPPPMKEAIEQFRTQLEATIDSIEFVKRALDRQVHETDTGKEAPSAGVTLLGGAAAIRPWVRRSVSRRRT
jgi:hypothetical protein